MRPKFPRPHQVRVRRPEPRRPPPEGMSLAQLASAAAVTTRAVRRYFEAGLLPRAPFRGSRTRYGRDHLARLLAVRALLRDRLDFAAIRARLAELGAAEFEAYLPPPVAAPSTSPSRSSPAPIAASAAAPAGGEAPWHLVPLLPGLQVLVRADASPAVRAIAEAFIAQCVGNA